MESNSQGSIMTNVDAEIEQQISKLEAQILGIEMQLEKNTNFADKLDYSAAIVSGIIAGLLDIAFVGEFDLQRGYDWSGDKVNAFVEHVAKMQGFEGKGIEKSIVYLEKFGAPSDKVMNKLGGSKQHHLRDFAHHASLSGLFFSVLTQFTGNAYGTNEYGKFIPVPLENRELIGKTIPEKLTIGVVHWILHMASDMAGSAKTAGAGTGVPGPILSFVKLLSAIPIFNKEEQVGNLSLMTSKLFNGTLLAERDKNGKIMLDSNGKPLIHKMDLRGEIGVFYELGKQAMPVIINEALVRGFYFINRLARELKEKDQIKEIDWKKTIPFSNRTIERMATISSFTFTAVNAAKAGVIGVVKSGTDFDAFISNSLLNLNIAGIGRFVLALGTEASFVGKNDKLSKKQNSLRNEVLHALDARLYRSEALLLSAAKGADSAVKALSSSFDNREQEVKSNIEAVQNSMAVVEQFDLCAIKNKNADLLDKLSSVLF